MHASAFTNRRCTTLNRRHAPWKAALAFREEEAEVERDIDVAREGGGSLESRDGL